MKKIELLSPAGNFESLKYAVQNGADAVYLGLNRYSARASAENFNTERLSEAISYAHVRGVKVYLAINTLMDDYEIGQAVELATEADKMHVDAFIVQDIGLSQKLRKKVKAPLHASTQMTIYNEEGLKILKELGFSRCILSRELSIQEIAEICEKNIMEIEVFCHGAICISYSGQCLLSSAIGGRSGNKGMCAQPCRLKYSILKNNKEVSSPAYRISPNDLNTLPYLKELIGTGIDSLKIEGRLKSPEYTGLVTAKYRKALDIIKDNSNIYHYTQKDISDLSVMFSRGSFSSYHHLNKMPFSDITYKTSGRQGIKCGEIIKPKIAPIQSKKKSSPDIFDLKVKLTEVISKGDGITIGDTDDGGKINSIKTVNGNNILTAKSGDTVTLNIAGSLTKPIKPNTNIFKTYDDALFNEIKNSTMNENRNVLVTVSIVIKKDEPILLTISDSIREIKVQSNMKPEEAKTRAITKDDVEKQISKFGNTVYKIDCINIELDDNIFIPMSELANIRREAIDKLNMARIEGV